MKKPALAHKSSKKRPGETSELQSLGTDGVVGEGAELHLELPGFEGPFDLLLHLIHEHELDILNIPVAFVTDKYLQYLSLMQELNIDVASDYLVMAATLAHIKSRMLLPVPPADDDADGDESERDPRADLIRRLLEYQKYKQVAQELASRSVLGRDVFTRGASPEMVEGPAPLAQMAIFKLLEAFQRLLTRANTVLDHQIEFERLSITDRINQLVDRLHRDGRLSFEQLFEGQRTRAELIVTFLALLEMTRLRLTNIHQESALAPIAVELAVTDGDSISDAARDVLTRPEVLDEKPEKPVQDSPVSSDLEASPEYTEASPEETVELEELLEGLGLSSEEDEREPFEVGDELEPQAESSEVICEVPAAPSQPSETCNEELTVASVEAELSPNDEIEASSAVFDGANDEPEAQTWESDSDIEAPATALTAVEEQQSTREQELAGVKPEPSQHMQNASELEPAPGVSEAEIAESEPGVSLNGHTQEN